MKTLRMAPVLRSRLLRYGSALVAVLLAWLLHWLLEGVVADHGPYEILLLTVALVSRYTGVGPALLVTALGALVVAHSFLPPRASVLVQGTAHLAGLVVYLAVSVAIALLGNKLRGLRQQGALLARAVRGQQAQMVPQRARRPDAARAVDVLAEERLQLILDSVPVLISYVDEHGCYRLINRGYELWFGHERSQITGKHLREVLGEAPWAAIRSHVEAALSGQGVSFESVVPHRDGGEHYMHADYIPQVGKEGKILGFVALVRDITEQKRAEAALVERAKQFRQLMDTANEGIWTLDTDARVTEVNERLVAMLGHVPEDVLGRVKWDFLLEEDVATARALFERRRAGLVEQASIRLRHRDGHAVWTTMVAKFLVDEKGRLQGALDMFTDMSEQKRAEEALRETDRRKDEFLATLAHELRNPLAPVRNAVQILRTLSPADPTLAWARDVIDRQVQQMARLVDDLLDVSRITRGKIQLRREQVVLGDVVSSALETSRPLIEASGHTLTVTLPPEPLQVEGDAIRLAQVLSNLLNNAAKYTEQGGHIWLQVEREDAHAIIRVRDDGVGIPQDMLPRIFDMFIQVDRSVRRSQGGLGIGLTLVASLVEMHGGTVSVHSDGPGQGSEFVVRLPLAAAQASHALLASSADEAGKQTRPLRVLVVDDNEDSADTLAMILRLRGNEVYVANDGRRAVEMAMALTPDLVLLDIGLPDLSGYQVARQIRQQPALAQVVLIAQTGWGQDADRRQSQAAGFDHHLVKPIDLSVLDTLLAGIRDAAGHGGVRPESAR